MEGQLNMIWKLHAGVRIWVWISNCFRHSGYTVRRSVMKQRMLLKTTTKAGFAEDSKSPYTDSR